MFCYTSQQGGIPLLCRHAAHQETQIFLYITHLDEVKQLLNEAGNNFLKRKPGKYAHCYGEADNVYACKQKHSWVNV